MDPADFSVPAIGLFLGFTEDTFENQLMAGAWEATQDAGTRLVLLNSGPKMGQFTPDSLRNILFDLVSQTNIDALILPASVCHGLDADEMVALCAKFAPIPVVTILYEVPGIHSVVSGNRRGMEALMDHLIDDHGYVRIAFLGGPADQQEAEVRKQVFLEKTRAKGLKFRPEWMATGDFGRQSGFLAVDKLLEQGSLSFQGIVAASDQMALGAIEALGIRGYQVPRDLFVTGFDDLEESHYTIPPLTTVRQSPRLQAREAVRVVLRILRGEQAARVTDIPVECIIRSSCGCPAWSPNRMVLKGEIRDREEAGFWHGRLSDSFDLALMTGASALFFSELDLLLHEATGEDLDTFWQSSLSMVRETLFKKNWTPGQIKSGEGMIHSARMVVSENSLRMEATGRLQSVVMGGKVIACGEALVTSYSLGSIGESLGAALPGMGFKGAWISLFRDPLQPGSGLVPALDLDRVGSPTDTGVFPATDFVPGGLKAIHPEHRLLAVEVLHSRQEHLGIMVLSANPAAVRTTGSLRNQVSGALQGIRFLEARQAAEHQLFQTEKFAALGNLVAGVAHEINTPLGIAVGASTHLRTTTQEFQQLYLSGKMRKSDLEAYFDTNMDITELMVSNLSRAADLVTHFKQVAVDQTSENRRTFAFTEYLEETLDSLRSEWKKRPLAIGVQGPPNLTFDSFPGALAQVVTNLLMNSLAHGFPQDKGGRIDLLVEDQGADVRFLFSDDGQGIAPEHLPRIFEPFFTTKRGQGGTGLGLQVVHNLVNQVLGGTVICRSEQGKGTTFELRLPKVAPGSEEFSQAILP